MKKIWEAAMLLFALAGFWGMIYPDLCFTEDVCGIIYIDGESGRGQEKTQSGQPATDSQKKTQSGQPATDGQKKTQSGQPATAGQEKAQSNPTATDIQADKERTAVTEPDLFTQICEAKPEQIRIRFTLARDRAGKKESKDAQKSAQK